MSNLVYDTFAAPRYRAGNAILRQVLRVLGTWVQRAQTRRYLRDLDDRLLRDVGLTRDTARIEAAKPFWRS